MAGWKGGKVAEVSAPGGRYSVREWSLSEAEWPADLPDKLYVVAHQQSRPESEVFTISPDPRACGWSTDWGVNGYGLPLHVAEALVAAYNAARVTMSKPQGEGSPTERGTA